MSETTKKNIGRVTMNVDVTAAARAKLKAYCARKKKVQREVLAALLDWFSRQPDCVQTVVMGEVDQGLEAAYAKVLDDLASQLEPQRVEVNRQDPQREPGEAAGSRAGKSRKGSASA